MACESTERMLLGFMLATSTTSLPSICSALRYLTSPLTTCRGAASPRSTCST